MDRHDTLLIACGSAENRQLLRTVLHERYNLLEASNVQQALLLMEQNRDCIAAVVLDVSTMEQRDKHWLDQQSNRGEVFRVPVIVACHEDSEQVLNKAFAYGASDVIPLNYEPYAMLHRIENIVDLYLHKQHLETMVQEQANALRQSSETMVDALSSIIEYRSAESGQHILRIRHFTKILLEEVVRSCPEYRLTAADVALISSASALHDIGKIAISDEILMKSDTLSPQERETMQTHCLTGCEILRSLGNVGDPEYMRYAYNICHYHHERWDGGGYPEGLAGDEIPICAQVVGLADVYDALISQRVYKEAFSFAKSANMILQGECGAFSPKLLECFKHVTKHFEKLAKDYADGLSPKSETFDMTLPAPERQRSDSMERVRAKYFALVHYVNGLLLEADLDQRLFHIIYNPYPEFSWMQGVSSFEDLVGVLLEQVIVPQERQRLLDFLQRYVPAFVEEDLRRSSHYFRFRTPQKPEGELFEVTLLRINLAETDRRTLGTLWRRVENGSLPSDALPILSDSTFCCRNDQHFTLLELDGRIPALAGYTREELARNFGNRLMELIIPEDRDRVRREFYEQFTRGSSAQTEFRVRHRNGNVIWVLDKSRLSIGADGNEYVNAFLTDITHIKRDNDALSDKLRRYELILAQTENVLFEWDMLRNTVNYSDTWEQIFGFRPAHQDLREILTEGSYFHPDDLPRVMDCIGNLQNGSSYEMAEIRIATARGRYLWCRLRASAIRDDRGGLEKVAGIIINIDAEKQAQRLLQDRAERDSLTRLLNKNAARKYAEEYLTQLPEGARGALLIIDLDNFKQVKDQYGHLFGDAVLTKVAREIEKQFRNQDLVARIGGDEFLVLMRGVADRTLLENRCRQLLDIFQTIFRTQRYQLPMSASIGIALAPEHGSTYFDLYNHADQALYRVKASGKNTYLFYDAQDARFLSQTTRDTTHIDSDEEPGLAEDTLVRYAFQRLYSSRDMESSVNEILAMVGKKMNVSRVYVFENSEDNRFCSNTFEWCNEGIKPEISWLQNISYERDIPGYEDNFNEQGIFYCPDVAVLPKETFDIVNAQGIKSMLQCAIREGGVFRGYIGFDECVEQRLWTKEQIQTLTYFSEMLSLFLMKERKQAKVRQHAEDVISILDNQNAWIYIIDPDTCELRYVNKKANALAPDVRQGMRCYQALMGRQQRCPGCPALGIREKGNERAVICNEKFGMNVLADATLIQWEGKGSCLLTCREIPKTEN